MDNPRSERVRALAALARRSTRSRNRQFLAEGPQAVREALALQAGEFGPAPTLPVVAAAYATPAAAERHADLLALAGRAGVTVREISPEAIARVTDTVHAQGVVAVCRFVDRALDEALAARPRLVAVLDRVRDPGNAGTILRVADAAGAGAVVFTAESVDVYNPKTVRSTAGSLFHLDVVTGPTLAEVRAAAHAAGLQVFVADGNGDTDLDALADRGGLDAPTAWVVGNEAWGFPAADRELADAVVAVPIHGRAESLNVATAATVCLYASARAHRPAS